MTLLQRLNAILEPEVVTQLFFDAPPVGTEPPFTVCQIVHSHPYTTQEGTVTELTPVCIQFATYSNQASDRDSASLAIITALIAVKDDGIRSAVQTNRHSMLDTHYKLPVDIVEFDIQETY